MSHILAAGAARMKLEAGNYEARIAALEAKLAERVKVKSLEWDRREADTLIGSYRIDIYGSGVRVYLDGVPIRNGYGHVSEKEAKAAAQADYERRILSALDTHPRATSTFDARETANVSDKPEGQQEPVAWEWAAFEEEERRGAWTPCGYGDEAGWKALVKRNPAKYRVETRPLYTRPSEQAVTEAMVEAASREYMRIFGKHLLSKHARLILTAAMEARHD